MDTPLLARASGLTGGPGGRSFGRTPEQGADTVVWLASSADVEGLSGRYWIDRRPVACRFRDETQEAALRDLCASMCAA